uniref:Major facilitator superfamily (MFS) profile domain-containing protein n=1 Tax=Manihot esculenta TaxID=3983 RepID=A0A2C9U2K1_MANES
MATSDLSTTSTTTSIATPLMEDTVDGTVDYNGRPAHRSSSGGWRSASFIIAVEVAERFAYYGISSNLISYLTSSLGQSTAIAAENVNTWSGTATLLPLLGGFVADSFLGRHRTILFASLIYILGLSLLTLSATLTSVDVSECENTKNGTSCSPPTFQAILFFFSLYLVAVGQGGHKPCVQAFGADQFNGLDPKESVAKRFLNKALLARDGSMEDQEKCSVSDVKETKALLSLIPIWATCLAYAIAFAQSATFFTKQGVTMDRTIFAGFQIPAASLQTFIGFAIILSIPIYDRIFVPLASSLTGNLSGIAMLQRIGTGMIISTLSMVIAALVEKKRLKIAEEHGMVDLPNATIPMTIWWLVPQYVLCGVADVFTIVGLQEFFYDQVPEGLRSVGLSLYLSVLGVGQFLSSFLVSVIDKATSKDGQDSWFSNNLNRAHLDYFYWLLAALSVIGFLAYLIFARSYIYRKGNES